MYVPSKKIGQTVKYLLRFAYLFAFLGAVTIFEHYVNSFWPPQQVVVVSNKSTLPAPIPVPTEIQKPLTLEQQFQPYADKICGGIEILFSSFVVQRIEIEDNKTTAMVFCMRQSDHEVYGPYEIGL